MNFVMRLYSALARAFPQEFKIVYGADMLLLGEDMVADIARENGFFGLFRLLLDLLIRVPVEYLAEMRRDLLYALRTLAKSRGFAAVGIVSLALGIGVTAVSVSEVLNLIMRDAPGIHDPDKLVMISGEDGAGNTSYAYIERYRDLHTLIAGAAAFQTPVPYNISLPVPGAKAERVFGQLVSPEYFPLLGLNAAQGRVFSAAVDKPGSPPLVFISDRFWRRRLNADPDAVGRAIRVNGQTAAIVGVGPKDFLGALPFIPADIFVPTTAPAAMAPELAGDILHQRDAKAFSALLRLAPGVTLKSAEAGLDAVTRNLDRETLDPARNLKGRRVTLLPGGKILPIPRSAVPVMLGFMATLDGLIIAIACMNLANMQLARATARRKEVAIRLSVGASRFRLIRQLLTESALLSVAGGAGGIMIAFFVARLLRTAKLPVAFPVSLDITPDWRVIAIVFLVSLVTGIGFGLAPALAATKADLAASIKDASIAGQARGHRRFGMRNLLMVGQVAGSLALLLIAGFMIIGFRQNNNVEIAFDPSTMYLLSLDPVRDGYSAEKAANLFDHLADRLKRTPGVREVAMAQAAPFGPQVAAVTFGVPSGGGSPDRVVSAVAKNTVGPNYFAAISAPVLEGREFDMRDQRIEQTQGKVRPVLVNQTAARALFGAGDPLGRRITDASKSYEVVGMVKDVSAPMSEDGAGQTLAAVPVVYLPLGRNDFAHPPANGMIVMVRSDRGFDAIQKVRAELATIDPNLAIFDVHTLATQVSDTLVFIRIQEYVYGGVGAFGLILAAIGLAGVTAYSVARRRKEIGIRMALGARKGQVLRLVMREGGTLVAIGSALGLLGAVALSRALSAFSAMFGPAFQAGARDPRLILGAPLLLAALAMLACYIPARRAMRIDPQIALREE